VAFQLPSRLSWLEGDSRGREWLRELPSRVGRCAAKWDLRLEAPYAGSYVSVAFPVTLRDGFAAVLKVQWPHEESEFEHEALRFWDGRGAVRLLDFDQEERALLLERCTPGEPLSSIGSEEALDVFVALLPRLWIPAGEPFRSLDRESAGWRDQIPVSWERAHRPCETALLDAALEAIDHLRGTEGEQVLLHQDLHGDNVLRSQREPWLAIDPKPLVGEREFSLAPLVRSYEFGHSRSAVVHRLDKPSSALGLDRERCRLWALAQTLAWGFDGSAATAMHIETARWLWQA
jgi:streptomycin 6-kinase